MKTSIIDKKKDIKIKEKKLSLKEILHYVNTTSAHKDSQVALFEDVEEKYTAKLNWVGKNKWKVDYPISRNDIHKQRYLGLKQCLQFIEIMYTSNDVYRLKGFIDVPIRHFTLDEMIEFKKEDELMLRGQDPYVDNTNVSTPKDKVTAPKPLQKQESPSKEINPDKVKSKSQKTIKNDSDPAGDDSFFRL